MALSSRQSEIRAKASRRGRNVRRVNVTYLKSSLERKPEQGSLTAQKGGSQRNIFRLGGWVRGRRGLR